MLIDQTITQQPEQPGPRAATLTTETSGIFPDLDKGILKRIFCQGRIPGKSTGQRQHARCLVDVKLMESSTIAPGTGLHQGISLLQLSARIVHEATSLMKD